MRGGRVEVDWGGRPRCEDDKEGRCRVTALRVNVDGGRVHGSNRPGQVGR